MSTVVCSTSASAEPMKAERIPRRQEKELSHHGYHIPHMNFVGPNMTDATHSREGRLIAKVRLIVIAACYVFEVMIQDTPD